MKKFLAGLCAYFLAWHSLFAWNSEGHMVVAQIAYNHLQPDVKAQCDALIAVPLSLSLTSTATATFVTASSWADDFKSQLGTGNWHYIDQIFSLDGTATNGVTPDSFDVVQAINLCVTNLQSKTATQSAKATYLRYLIHFVGDVQQPLHCSDAVSASLPGGDAGGNSFSIKGSWSNLHSLWDSGGGFLTDSVSRPLSVAAQNTLNSKVTLIETDYPYNYNGTNVGIIPDPQTWAAEGLVLAETVSYVNITRGVAPTTSYLNTAKSTTEQRMAAGGHRLADLLNTIFAARTITVGSMASTPGGFQLSWNSVGGRTYSVQSKQQLSDPFWQTLTNIVASGVSCTFTDAPGQTNRFYRIVQ